MPPKRKQTDDTTSAPAATKKAKATATRAAPAKAMGKAASTASAKTPQTSTTSAATSRVVATPAVTEAAAPPKPVYTGKFDLYSTRLKFLMSEYLPEGTSKPRHEAVYNKILTYQAKNDFTVRIALMDSDPASGKFHTVCITNPFSEEPIEEPIFITGGKNQDVTFDKGEGAHVSAEGAARKAPGYAANLDFEGDSANGCIGVIGGNGSIKMRKMWEKIVDGERKELFEGYCCVRVQHGAMLRSKGHGPSSTFNMPFWAIRARKDDDGKEIGIDAGDGRHVSRSSGLDDDDDLGFGGYDESDESEEDGDSDDDSRPTFGIMWDMYGGGGSRRHYGCH